MLQNLLEELWFEGFAPRTLLDVGAHVGGFTQAFLRVFPDCAPTLVEPNPHCAEALSRLPYERHAFAAGRASGAADLFLTTEWPASTGASLHREKTAFFRDEVLDRAPVAVRPLDEVFADRTFDFIKIDVQGGELDVIAGAERLIRRARRLLIEISVVDYNEGGAPAEAVFAALGALGFRSAIPVEFHRLSGVAGGALLQIDFLFTREPARPSQNHRFARLHEHGPLLNWLIERKRRAPEFRVLDVGASANPWTAPVLSAALDLYPCPAAALNFSGNLNDPRGWDAVLAHVAREGRFDFVVCSHTLEDLAYPQIALEMLPRVAEAGYIATPSRYLELTRPEAGHRGFIHHRWILDVVDGGLVLAPKMGFLEQVAVPRDLEWAKRPDRFELQMLWRGGLDWRILNNDYLGPTRDAVLDYYRAFTDRP